MDLNTGESVSYRLGDKFYWVFTGATETSCAELTKISFFPRYV